MFRFNLSLAEPKKCNKQNHIRTIVRKLVIIFFHFPSLYTVFSRLYAWMYVSQVCLLHLVLRRNSSLREFLRAALKTHRWSRWIIQTPIHMNGPVKMLRSDHTSTHIHAHLYLIRIRSDQWNYLRLHRKSMLIS